MGYTTDFTGAFDIEPTLKSQHKAYLDAFATTRRMARDAVKAELLPDPLRLAAELPIGDEGAYYVGAAGDNFGQNATDDVLNQNNPPQGQPGLWCQWVCNENSELEWDGNEKFYDYIEWLEYLVEHFFKPWGYVLNGRVAWSGEEPDDIGVIRVDNNEVKSAMSEIVNELDAV
jgi:hypothetical protein